MTSCPLLSCSWGVGGLSEVDVFTNVSLCGYSVVLLETPPTDSENGKVVPVGFGSASRARWHLACWRPEWDIDMYSLRGKHSAFHGLCRRSYHDQEPGPAEPYGLRYDLGWHENYNRYPDRPNTKITNCLAEVFGLPYEPELGRYQVRVSAEARARAAEWLESVGCGEWSREWRVESGARRVESGARGVQGALHSPLSALHSAEARFNAVVLHYQGNTSQEKKNLAHEQVRPLLDLCLDMGYVPIILDWDGRSPLYDNRRVFNPGVHPGDLWGGFGSGDAEMITALISLSSAFIGVDSGPGKCASATDTPSLICWTRMHPVQFHDPADNTVHLVPENHRDIPPAQVAAIAEYFEKHYEFMTYRPGAERALTEAAAAWLEGVVSSQRSALSTPSLVKELTIDNCQLAIDNCNHSPPTTHHSPDLIFRYGFWIPAENPIQSWTIIEDVYVRDAYKTGLRPQVDGVEYVVDVGANIGAFAKLWHKRNPEARLACVEVNPKLLPALEANAGKFATIIPKACHYGSGLRLLDSVCATGLSIGGSRVVGVEEWRAESDPQYEKAEAEVATITLEEIQEELAFPRIDILKLDCEGSEFSILENADLSRIGTIFVESHGSKRWRELLARKFQGWDIGHMSRSECGEFENWHLVNPGFGVIFEAKRSGAEK